MPPSKQIPSIEIVHDYLTQRGGAERVVGQMAEALQNATIWTSLYEPSRTFENLGAYKINVSWLQRVPGIRSHHRWALPLYPIVFGQHQSTADVTICSTSGWAHGVRCTGRKIVYAYNTARWLYQTDQYLRQTSPLFRKIVEAGLWWLRWWDRRAINDADVIIAISADTQRRIEKHWSRKSVVLHPPHAAEPHGPKRRITELSPGFYLCVTRLLPYKNVDAVLDAARRLSDKTFVVVGKGPDRARLNRMASANVRFLGTVSDEELRWLYSESSAVIGAAFEDMGLTPLEGMAFGKPVAALRAGGYMETVLDGVTGVFFDSPTGAALSGALLEIERRSWDAALIASHAASFSPEEFRRSFRDLVDTWADAPAGSHPYAPSALQGP